MENKYQVLLFDKSQENYAGFISQWSALSPAELIGKAQEIYATQMVKEHLMRSVDEPRVEWLLRFDNPLEIMRDKWTDENGMGMVPDEDFSHVIWSVMDCQDTESLYLLTPGVEPTPGRDEPVTVREFIERHPGVAFDMLTPGGFVYLTPEKAQLLLSGQSIYGNPGNPEYAMKITAEELLNQEVIRANFTHNVWHLLSSEIHNMNQEQLLFEQGVTMC